MYERALRLEPNNAETYHNLGFAYFKQGRLRNAEAAYERSVQLDDNNVFAHLDRAARVAAARRFPARLGGI